VYVVLLVDGLHIRRPIVFKDFDAKARPLRALPRRAVRSRLVETAMRVN
jgi:hypothetical protein